MPSQQELMTALSKLPEERWQTVLDFINGLAQSTDETRPMMTGQDWLNSGLVGMWADRTDIGSSVEFARKLREQVQTRKLPDAR